MGGAGPSAADGVGSVVLVVLGKNPAALCGRRASGVNASHSLFR